MLEREIETAAKSPEPLARGFACVLSAFLVGSVE